MSNKFVKIAEDSARGGFSLFFGDVASTVILAMGSILIARLLGPSGYGLYALALVVPALFSSLISLGIDDALIRFLAKLRVEGRGELVARILRVGLMFRLLTGVAMSVVGLLFSDFLAAYLLNRPELGFYVKLASFAILFQALFASTSYAYVGLDRMERSALLKGLMSFVKASSAPLLIVLGFGVAGAILGYVVGYVVAGVTGLLLLFACPYRTLKASSSSDDDDGGFRDFKLMVGYGFPLYLTSLLSIVLTQFQLMLLAYYTSNLEIGNFNAALNFTVLIDIIFFPVALALFPAFSKLSSESEATELRRFFTLSAKYASLLIVPASTAVFVLSRELVYVVYGPSYGLAPLFLSLYTISFLYAGMGSTVLGSFFKGIGETKLTLKVGIVNAIVFVSTAPLLTHLYGVLGLIAAFLTSSLVSLLYGLLIARKRYAVSLDPAAQSRIYLASILSALPALLFLQLSSFGSLLNLAFGGALFLFTYLTIIPILGAVRAYDVENLKLIFSRIKVVWAFLKPVLAYEAKLISAFK